MPPIKLFNTLGRRLQTLKSLKDGEVSLYTCGPTVYSYYHIGNLRNAVFNDTLRRMLEANDLKVKHVMNITDVGHLVSDGDDGEDKLEKGAKHEGRTVWEVAEAYILAFKADMAELNVLPPNGYKDGYARATDFIEEQLAIIKILVDKDFAYKTEQAIYFDTTKLGDYGKLTGQDVSEKETAARADVVSDSHKRQPADFALWFFATGRFKNHEMRWDSPWGEGFPGWHLECSAIIHATLGEPIDIHTGGVDLIGTHHTNEIAQTEAAFGTDLAHYWVHNEHLLVEGQKMSKSLKNDYTLDDIRQRGIDPLALRLLYLQAHYRSQMNFSWEALSGAQTFLQKLRAWADLIHQPDLGHAKGASTDYEAAYSEVLSHVNNDLNTADALAVVAKLVDEAEQVGVDIAKLKQLLGRVDDLLGLNLAKRPDLSKALKDKLTDRQTARDKRDWATADRLRDELAKDGVEINDTPHGQVWSRS